MNETTETPALVTPPASRQTHKPAPGALWLAILALGGVILLGVFAWRIDQRLDAARAELLRRLADSEAKLAETLASARLERASLDQLQAKLGALEARLAEMQSQQAALQTLSQEWSRSRAERALFEVEQALGSAAQQLQLAGNVGAALSALAHAETLLAQSGQPQFQPLRKLISRDIERLRASPAADVTGIALKLDRLSEAALALPLAFERRPAPGAQAERAAPAAAPHPSSPPSGATGMLSAWLGEVWGEIKQLVRIERVDTSDAGLLAPRETFFLRENLRLRLLSARLALLARDGRTYQADLRQAIAWLERYFDTRAPAVQEAATALRELAKLDIVRAPLDLDETLAALRHLKLGRERGKAVTE